MLKKYMKYRKRLSSQIKGELKVKLSELHELVKFISKRFDHYEAERKLLS